MRRRWISLIVTAMLATTAFSGVAAAAELTSYDKYELLKQKGIFTGFADGTARLDKNMSREQFAAVLFRLLDLHESSASPSYNDVLRTRWSFGEIEAVTEAGLMAGIGKSTFGPASPVTVEQLATIMVRVYGDYSNSDNSVWGKVSSWARLAVAQAIEKDIIPVMNDYTVDATRAMLVNAAYQVLQHMAEKQYVDLQVQSIDVLSSTKLAVHLSKPVKVIRPENFTILKVYSNNEKLSIRQATLSSDGKTVEIITGQQESATQYILQVDRQAKNFISPTRDTTKPKITSFRATGDNWLSITFSEPVNADTATDLRNYSVSDGLSLYSAYLSNDSRTVSIQTSAQKSNTKYNFVIYRVEDQAGNVLDPTTYSFGDEDRTAPIVTRVTSDVNRVTLWFSERLNESTAENVANYVIDGGLGYPSQLKYNDSNQTVTLTTMNQVNNRSYRLTLDHIKDRAGNEIKSGTKVTFTGVADSSLAVQSVQAVNKNTLLIKVNDALTQADLANLNVVVSRDNNNSVSMSGWQSYVTLQDSKTITVQYRLWNDPNPSLFEKNHQFIIAIQGLPQLATENQANVFAVAGTDERNDAPTVTSVKAVNSRTIQVQFSEPVKNASKEAFAVKDQDGRVLSIQSDNISNSSKVINEITLTLTDKLRRGQPYTLSFSDKITDAAGWNTIKANADEPFVSF